MQTPVLPKASIRASSPKGDQIIRLQDLQALQQIQLTNPTIRRPSASLYHTLPIPPDSKCIRVLELKGARRWEDPLVGNLKVIVLDQEPYPVFQALSYVWGTYSTPKHTLSTDFCELEITQNCHNALRRIRKLNNNTNLWVDALCINQDDHTEKAHQIQLMRDIYSCASLVYISLGESTPELQNSMSILRRAAKFNIFPIERLKEPDVGGRPGLIKRATFIVKISPPAVILQFIIRNIRRIALRIQYSPRRGIDDLVDQEWFSRVWTFQEAALACNITVLYGNDFLMWDTLVKGVTCLRTTFDSSGYTNYLWSSSTWITYDGDLVHTIGQSRQSEAMLSKSFRMLDSFVRVWTSMDTQRVAMSGSGRAEDMLVRSFTKHQEHYNRMTQLFTPDSGFKTFLIWMATMASFACITLGPVIACVPAGYIRSPVYLLPLGLLAATLTWISMYGVNDKYFWLGLKESHHGEESHHEEEATTECIIRTIRERQANDPKDKSYAMYAILQSLKVELAEPDYAKSQGEIYHNLLVGLLKWRPQLIVSILDANMCLRDTNPDMDKSPSWVPDWHNLPQYPTISSEYFSMTVRRTYDATRLSIPSAEFDNNGDCLIVRGHWGGYITLCTPRFERISTEVLRSQNTNDTLKSLIEPLTAILVWLDALRYTRRFSAPRKLTNRFPGGMRNQKLSSPDELAVFDTVLLLKRESFFKIEDFTAKQLLQLYRLSSQHTDTTSQQDSGFRIGVEKVANDICKVPDLLKFLIDLINDLANGDRCLFMVSGGYVGCGSTNLSEGDRIALIAGVPAPLALRPESVKREDWFQEDYSVCCSTFVSSWMDGRAFVPSKANQIRLI